MNIQFPIAIDYKHPASVGHVSLPLPPVPEGWTRLFAADYSAGDEFEDVPAVTEERTVPAVTRQVALLTDPPQYVDEVVTPERTETVTLVPATRRQTASGVCKEYQRRAEEWAAQQPAQAPVPEPVPQEVTNRAFRLALRAVTGIRPSAVTTALQALPDDDQREDALSEWEYANTISRANALLPLMAARFGVSTEQLDNIFREAAKL